MLKYDDEDVRLSHVGTYVEPNGNTHLILCILSSTEDDGESFVNKHANFLKQQIIGGVQEKSTEYYVLKKGSGWW